MFPFSSLVNNPKDSAYLLQVEFKQLGRSPATGSPVAGGRAPAGGLGLGGGAEPGLAAGGVDAGARVPGRAGGVVDALARGGDVALDRAGGVGDRRGGRLPAVAAVVPGGFGLALPDAAPRRPRAGFGFRIGAAEVEIGPGEAFVDQGLAEVAPAVVPDPPSCGRRAWGSAVQ